METNQANTIATNTLPTVTLQLLTGEKVEGGRSAGIFTETDLISLLLYVRGARQLPTSLDALKKLLRGDSTGIPGLEPVDVVTLYGEISGHANRWTPVEAGVKDQSVQLTLAARDLVRVGDAIIATINKMDVVEQLSSIQGSTTTFAIESTKDKQVQAALPEVLGRLKATCVEQQEKSRKVLSAVRDYKTEISGGELTTGALTVGLEPMVADKRKRANDANLSGRIETLQREIDQLGGQIDQLKKDYDKFVGLAFTGAAGGPIGLLITGGIFGAKAEAARHQRNDLIEQKGKKSAELARDQVVQGALNVLATQLTDIGLRLVDAEQALLHLDLMWTDISIRIDQSVTKWGNVKDSDMLLTFVTDLRGIVEPWRQVGDMAGVLARVFDQAYAEFRKIYGA